jgi:hypothetical protein
VPLYIIFISGSPYNTHRRTEMTSPPMASFATLPPSHTDLAWQRVAPAGRADLPCHCSSSKANSMVALLRNKIARGWARVVGRVQASGRDSRSKKKKKKGELVQCGPTRRD